MTSAFGPTTNGLYCYPPSVNGCSASWTDHLPLLGGILVFMNIYIGDKKLFFVCRLKPLTGKAQLLLDMQDWMIALTLQYLLLI